MTKKVLGNYNGVEITEETDGYVMIKLSDLLNLQQRVEELEAIAANREDQ